MTPLVLDRSKIASLFTLDDYVAAVEAAFHAYAERKTLTPVLAHVDAPHGEFHIKAGGLVVAGCSYFGLKVGGAFFGNAAAGLPTIQGILYLASAETGAPLAVMDSIHVTIQRTGAATAVAAKYLARPEANVATICGAGRQGRIQLQALATVRKLTTVYVWDRTPEIADRFAREMSAVVDLDIVPVRRAAEATVLSDLVVTCTASRAPLLLKGDVVPGTFVAAVGADSPDKQELDPAILATAKVVTDITAQCAAVGDLHHAITAGVMTAADVHAELGDIIAGLKPGRTAPDEIIVYDSTGTALQDVACAAAIYEKARQAGVGTTITL